MKREDLKALGLTDDAVIDAVMTAHGKDVEKFKASVDAAKAETDALKVQLTEASTAIEGFKKLDIDSIKAAADDYKTKYEQAQSDSAKQLAALKFDHSLEGALAEAKAKNPKAVQALLNKEALKFNEADGSIIGLKEQLEKVKADNDYLFSDFVEPPRVVTGGNNQTLNPDVTVSAMRAAAGLKP